jgi:hypothetical protein
MTARDDAGAQARGEAAMARATSPGPRG